MREEGVGETGRRVEKLLDTVRHAWREGGREGEEGREGGREGGRGESVLQACRRMSKEIDQRKGNEREEK